MTTDLAAPAPVTTRPQQVRFEGDVKNRRKLNEKNISYRVFTNLFVRETGEKGDREFSSCRPLHEIPLLRKMYLNGTVIINPGWVRHPDRLQPMSESEFLKELDQLYGVESEKLEPRYTVLRDGVKVNLAVEIYGPRSSSRVREVTAEIAKAYHELQIRILARIKPDVDNFVRTQMPGATEKEIKEQQRLMINDEISDRDLDALVRLCLVADDTSEMELPELDLSVFEDTAKPAPTTGGSTIAAPIAPAAEGVGADLIDHLIDEGWTQADAQGIAALYETHKGAIPGAQISKFCNDNSKRIQTLHKHLAEFKDWLLTAEKA